MNTTMKAIFFLLCLTAYAFAFDWQSDVVSSNFTDPQKSSTEFLPKATIEGTDLVLTYKRSDGSETDTNQVGQWSTDLLTWSETDVTLEMVNENGIDPDDMKVRIPLSKAIDGKLYGRLQIRKP